MARNSSPDEGNIEPYNYQFIISISLESKMSEHMELTYSSSGNRAMMILNTRELM